MIAHGVDVMTVSKMLSHEDACIALNSHGYAIAVLVTRVEIVR